MSRMRWVWNVFFWISLSCLSKIDTPRKINMEPKHHPIERKIIFQTIISGSIHHLPGCILDIRYSWGLGMESSWRKGGFAKLEVCWEPDVECHRLHHLYHLPTAFFATLTNKGRNYDPVFRISRCSNIHLDWSIAVFQLGIPDINVPRYPMIY